MKNSVIIILVLCAHLGYAQSNSPPEPIDNKVFTINYDNAWYIAPLPKEKLTDKHTQIGVIESKPLSTSDIPFSWKESEFQYFRIGSSDQMLVLKSLEYMRRESLNAPKN